jgi:hypothetical protein
VSPPGPPKVGETRARKLCQAVRTKPTGRSDVKAVVTRARPRLPIAKSANTGHVVVFFFARFLSIFSSFPAVSPFAFSPPQTRVPIFAPTTRRLLVSDKYHCLSRSKSPSHVKIQVLHLQDIRTDENICIT